MIGLISLSSGDGMKAEIVEAFQRTARLRRSELFDDDKLMPITALEDAVTSSPGWVGSEWQSGTLLVGINPGGGGDAYQRNPSDDRLYGLSRAFSLAVGAERSEAFDRLATAWIDIQQTHNIWRIIGPILRATGESPSQAAFINVVPFRTRMDKPVPARVIDRAWAKAASPQIEALEPSRIIALGKKAWDILAPRIGTASAELILFKRGIGDSYIPFESQQVLRELERKVRR